MQTQPQSSLLSKTKNSKCASMDSLDSYSIKISAELIAPPVHHIITLSIMQSKFPSMWRQAKIIPVHKKGSDAEMANYRPIAILSPLGKVIEKVVYQQIYAYFNNNKLFHSNLQGYRRNRSTQTALIQMHDRWVKAANNGKVSGVVLLDLSAAFDLVDHGILLDKLEIYGVDQSFREWIKSYLTGREQSVWINHCYSPPLENNVGVPQGSNLGPLFFLLYYNDLLYSTDCVIYAYADDSTITYSDPSVADISEKLTNKCNEVSRWMLQNRLKLNEDKTHTMLIGTNARVSQASGHLNIEMNNIKVS